MIKKFEISKRNLVLRVILSIFTPKHLSKYKYLTNKQTKKKKTFVIRNLGPRN